MILSDSNVNLPLFDCCIAIKNHDSAKLSPVAVSSLVQAIAEVEAIRTNHFVTVSDLSSTCLKSTPGKTSDITFSDYTMTVAGRNYCIDFDGIVGTKELEQAGMYEMADRVRSMGEEERQAYAHSVYEKRLSAAKTAIQYAGNSSIVGRTRDWITTSDPAQIKLMRQTVIAWAKEAERIELIACDRIRQDQEVIKKDYTAVVQTLNVDLKEYLASLKSQKLAPNYDRARPDWVNHQPVRIAPAIFTTEEGSADFIDKRMKAILNPYAYLLSSNRMTEKGYMLFAPLGWQVQCLGYNIEHFRDTPICEVMMSQKEGRFFPIEARHTLNENIETKNDLLLSSSDLLLERASSAKRAREYARDANTANESKLVEMLTNLAGHNFPAAGKIIAQRPDLSGMVCAGLEKNARDRENYRQFLGGLDIAAKTSAIAPLFIAGVPKILQLANGTMKVVTGTSPRIIANAAGRTLPTAAKKTFPALSAHVSNKFAHVGIGGTLGTDLLQYAEGYESLQLHANLYMQTVFQPDIDGIGYSGDAFENLQIAREELAQLFEEGVQDAYLAAIFQGLAVFRLSQGKYAVANATNRVTMASTDAQIMRSVAKFVKESKGRFPSNDPNFSPRMVAEMKRLLQANTPQGFFGCTFKALKDPTCKTFIEQLDKWVRDYPRLYP